MLSNRSSSYTYLNKPYDYSVKHEILDVISEKSHEINLRQRRLIFTNSTFYHSMPLLTSNVTTMREQFSSFLIHRIPCRRIKLI